MAKSEYLSRLSANYASDNRAMSTVTLTMANGRTIMSESIGAFPDMTPTPEPEEAEEPEAEWFKGVFKWLIRSGENR